MRQDKMACNQVTALLSYYIDGKVSAQITYFIEQHLKRCKTCRARYEVLLKAITDIRDVKTQMENIELKKCVPVTANSITFSEKMSAYLDNELNDEAIYDAIKRTYKNNDVMAPVHLLNRYEIKTVNTNVIFEKLVMTRFNIKA